MCEGRDALEGLDKVRSAEITALKQFMDITINNMKLKNEKVLQNQKKLWKK